MISFGFDLEIILPWTTGLIELLGNDYISGLFEGLIYLVLLFIIMLYWVYTLHVYFDNIGHKRINLHKALIVFLSVYCLGFTSTFLDYFYDYQIERATEIVSSGGDNYESYSDAKVLFLDNAFLSKIKRGENIDQALFNKIYDNTISGYYGGKVSDYINESRSFSTNSSKIGDSADVDLTLAEISNNIFETKGNDKVTLLETTYKFHFTNETNENQEVKLNFETPNKLSVVTSLRLGMDLQLVGQIASRGAAAKVYEDSLRKNIDPALIEKVGLNTYSLRVFPIPSKTGNTQGRQLVEVKMITPITDKNVLYSPKFSYINLKIDDNSRLQSKIYNKNELIKEDIIKSSEIEKYLSNDHILKTSELKLTSNKKFSDICLSPLIHSSVVMNNLKLNNEKNVGNKINVFFDNSSSVNRNNADNMYRDIYDSIKNHNGKLNDVDLYSYNFDVTKITGIEDINYWYQIANIQNGLATNYNIVNQFNSLIAIETQQQQIDLDNYENSDNKYDKSYDNNSGNNTGNISNTRRGPINAGGAIDTSRVRISGGGIRHGINPGSGVYSSLRTEGTASIGMNFSGKTEISFIGLIIMLIYLLEYGLFISFIIKYIKEDKNNEKEIIESEIVKNKENGYKNK